MDYIVSQTGVTHAADYRRNHSLPNMGLPWVGDTWCGRHLFGRYAGGCIAPMIDCGSCKRVMRKRGWEV